MEQVRTLLTSALKTEEEAEVKVEIEKRLKMLEPDAVFEKVCVCCGKMFQLKPKKRLKQKFCDECLKKKFGSRA